MNKGGEGMPPKKKQIKTHTQRQHVLELGEMYGIESTTPQKIKMWLIDLVQKRDKIKHKYKRHHIEGFVQGLLKCFDEGMVNAADNRQLSKKTTFIRAIVDQDTGKWTICNNGPTFDLTVRQTMADGQEVCQPHQAFGYFLSSSHFDAQDDTAGGCFGVGGKIINVYCKTFTLSCQDGPHGLRYTQTWTHNMAQCGPAKITKAPASKSKGGGEGKTAGSWTQIECTPDYARFGMPQGLTDDMFRVLRTRCYLLAASTPKDVNVYFNGDKLPVASFQHFVDLVRRDGSHRDEEDEGEKKKSDGKTGVAKMKDEGEEGKEEEKGKKRSKRSSIKVYAVNANCEIAVDVQDTGEMQQFSCINNVHTMDGGTHVKYVADLICKHVRDKLKGGKKGGGKSSKNAVKKISNAHIQQYLRLFINLYVPKPKFNSQAKTKLLSTEKYLKQHCPIEEATIEKMVKQSGLMKKMEQWVVMHEQKTLSKGDGKKTSHVKVQKLDDANFAGPKKSHLCTLIVTEGDSAKALAIAGLSAYGTQGRDYYGVLPLKGKLKNTREVSAEALQKCEEITSLKAALGLKVGQDYQDVKSLRYGHLMCMADQDVDGIHITGLVLNYIVYFWPSLAKLVQPRPFMSRLFTPLVKFTKGKEVRTFYNEHDAKQWKEENKEYRNNPSKWHERYFKGLGTSTHEDGMGYFQNLQAHTEYFVYQDESDLEAVDLGFNKKRADARKEWINTHRVTDVHQTGEHAQKHTKPPKHSQALVVPCFPKAKLRMHTFIHRELVLFSIAANARAIPSLLDGFKPSERIVMFGGFKRNWSKGEVKVAQFAGYISELVDSHHGQKSTEDVIVSMAQDFVGTNNIPFFTQSGQFGSRLEGGKDSASSRYIFTKPLPMNRLLFPAEDDAILEYSQPGHEPDAYLPVIPLVLANGAHGIGMGYATNIPRFNPLDLVTYIKQALSQQHVLMQQEEKKLELLPFMNRFKGTFQHKEKGQGFLSRGCVQWDAGSHCVTITELPLKVWTRGYFEKLVAQKDKLDVCGKKVKKIVNRSGVLDVCIELTLQRVEEKEGEEKEFDTLQCLKALKLECSDSLSTSNMVLFNSEGKLKRYRNTQEIMEEFIKTRLLCYGKRKAHSLQMYQQELCWESNKIKYILAVNAHTLLMDTSNSHVLKQLKEAKFDPQPTKDVMERKGVIMEDEDEEKEEGDEMSLRPFSYLLRMEMRSMTKERIPRLLRKQEEWKHKIEALQKTTVEQLWLQDLETFVQAYQQQKKQKPTTSKKRKTAPQILKKSNTKV